MGEQANAALQGETFDEILSLMQKDFNASGMTDNELGELIDKEIKAYRAEKRPHAGKTFAEILAPAQQGFEESGLTEEDLDDFIDAEIKAYRAVKRANRQISQT